MPRYLVVGNETLDNDVLRTKLEELASASEVKFHVLVPATHPMGAWTESLVDAAAQERMEQVVASWRDRGWSVTGEIGEASAFRAIGDVLLRDDGFDAIVLSTHPHGLSKWLHQDLPHRLERAYPHPLIHVVAAPAEVY